MVQPRRSRPGQLATDPDLTLQVAADLAYRCVLGGVVINLPGGGIIARVGISSTGTPDPNLFIRKYLPVLRDFVPTYDFLAGGRGNFSDVNLDAADRNLFLLNLNDGLGVDYEAPSAAAAFGASPWPAGRDPNRSLGLVTGNVRTVVGASTATPVTFTAPPGSVPDGGRAFTVAVGDRGTAPPWYQASAATRHSTARPPTSSAAAAACVPSVAATSSCSTPASTAQPRTTSRCNRSCSP